MTGTISPSLFWTPGTITVEIFQTFPNKVSLPPSNWEWMLRGQEATADRVWAPPLSSISDLRIQRGDMQPVPIDFEFPCSAAADWFHWVADEFMDVEFCALLERAGVAEAILLSRSCNMYRDTEALRQILRRWCTSTHTFFFSWGELTITLEDVENHWLLPVLGDMDPFAVEMSEEETVEVGNDNSQIRAKFKNMSRQILRRYPDLRTNLPLVYRWISPAILCCTGLVTLLVRALNLSPDDTRSLTYLVRRQFGLDQGVPGSPSETLPRTPNIAPFLNDHAFDYWSPSVSRMTMSNKAEGPGFLCPITMHILWRPRLYLPLPKPQFLMPRGRAWASQNGMVHEMGGSCIALRFPSKLEGICEGGGGAVKGPDGSWYFKEEASLLQGPLSLKRNPAVDPPVDPTEDTSLPSKETESSAIQEESAPPSTKAKSQPRSKSVAVKKAKSKPTRKSAVAPPSSSEEPAAESATPVEKESAVPTPPSTIYDRTRSKRKAVEEQVRSQAKRKIGDEGEGSDQAPIVIEEVSGGDDVVDAGVGATEVNESTCQLQQEASGEIPVVTADVVPEAHEITRVMADETLVDVAHETAPVTADETLAGSAAEEDYDQGTDSVDSEETIADEPQPLQIIPFADQPEEPRAIDPIEFHLNPPFARMTSVVEGVSLFGVAPHFGRILREEGSPLWWLLIIILLRDFHWWPSPLLLRGFQFKMLMVVVWQTQRGTPVLVEKESVAHVVSAAAPSSSQTQSAVGVIIPGRVAAFFASFEERAPNPYPDWHFWRFEGPLVAYMATFGCIKMLCLFCRDCLRSLGTSLPILSLGAGFGGPMLSLLGSVLADMRRTSFKTLSEPKILSWRSVVQDLIAVGFDLDFMLEHLRKVARKFFGEAIASEMKIVQEQISSLQSTLAVLLSYQGELMSAAAASPELLKLHRRLTACIAD
uniref:Aminotransferase-like plant mobile domain-containing protein n=1 Tax=Fagus sylvatica TaxID=28930 RepID=A0A2N9EIL7_FAGSY